VGARTGDDYIRALRDGRQVWYAGRRIEDIPSHPGFAGSVRTLARLYDRQHDPVNRDVMTVEWEGDRISYSYLPPVTPADLAAKRRNIALWSDATLGHMGRYPDFCAELTVGLLDTADHLAAADPRFGHNARAYHRYCAERDLCLTHSLNDQFHDRSRPVGKQDDPDLCLRAVREKSEGFVVRGLRNLATLAALSDEVLVYPNGPRLPGEEDWALAFALPLNTPGLTIICRDLHAERAPRDRFPLTTRFDEVDASLVFDDVLVPWERVFAYRDAGQVSGLHRRISAWARFSTLVRLVSRLEAFLGVAALLTRWAGRAQSRPTQVAMGQLIQDLEVLRACIRAAEHDAFRSPGGFLAPRVGEPQRLHSIDAADRAMRIMQDLITSTLILTGGPSDLESPEIGPFVDRYFRGLAPSTRDHLRLLAVAADMVQSAFAARQQLYERLQSGEPDNLRARLYTNYDLTGPTERMLEFIRDEWDD
jgi:aromatic ring hydroxylase